MGVQNIQTFVPKHLSKTFHKTFELFFKWIKQYLRINQFFGRSENAVKCQIWIAVATYLLVAIARKRLQVPLSLHSMLQILSVTPSEYIPIDQLLTDSSLTMDCGVNGN